MTQGGSTYYYHNDHLGAPQRLTDEQGNTVWSATYDAFGQATVAPNSTITSNLRFPGQYYDEETGLHYNWHRYYDPTSGRYIQTDPLGFAAGDTNLYRYVANSPVNAIDPRGLYCDGWQIASNLAAGFGDGISFGLTVKIRQKMGTDHVVNKCSGLYKTTHFAGEMVTTTLIGAGIAKTGAWALSRVAPRLESFFGAATKAERALIAEGEAAAEAEAAQRFIHKNSLAYEGETHVYRIKSPDGTTYKIGESAQGVRVNDGASIRAEQQVRKLTREIGPGFESEIRKVFSNKAMAREYETKLIERFRRMFGKDSLPGNKTGSSAESVDYTRFWQIAKCMI